MVTTKTTSPDCLLVPTRNCKQSALCSGTNTTAGRSLIVFDHVMAHVRNSAAVLVQCEPLPSKRKIPRSWWATMHYVETVPTGDVFYRGTPLADDTKQTTGTSVRGPRVTVSTVYL
ncbi:hypothetical protein QTP88_002672 [Uroleucon formosanum]